MIDSVVKLWPVISGTAVAVWAVITLVVKRWTRKRDVTEKKQVAAERAAKKAVETAQAQANAAIAGHMHLLEQVVTDQSAELLRMTAEVEYLRKLRTPNENPASPKENQ